MFYLRCVLQEADVAMERLLATISRFKTVYMDVCFCCFCCCCCCCCCRKLTQQLERLLAKRGGSELQVEAAVTGLAGSSSSSSWRLQSCRRAAMALRLHCLLLPQLQVSGLLGSIGCLQCAVASHSLGAAVVCAPHCRCRDNLTAALVMHV
jgi:hypothetical protein